MRKLKWLHIVWFYNNCFHLLLVLILKHMIYVTFNLNMFSDCPL